MKPVRCAIYTRKSSEEGLEQSFNSLDAQREACAAYILSQASEGWTALPEIYDDGGLSGGSLERPALQRLLGEVRAGRIDIIVVYKVDRLTRSLLDFAKLVEAFDAAATSFVSVTQSFNTTTSMGRLTLNMLLSFAQFEREVTAERIRDKIAASKAKGMWMGGTPPLGYAPDGRTLRICEDHAAIVCDIYQRYLTLGNVRLLERQLVAERITSPVRTRSTREGQYGGAPFSRGQLYAILRNPVYVGQITHGAKSYKGLHAAIVTEELFGAVQALLDENRQGERRRTRIADPSLLAGKVSGAGGEALIAAHATKAGKRYRYYVSRSLQQGGALDDAASTSSTGMRVPARELETAVTACVADAFADAFEMAGRAGLVVTSAALAQLDERSAATADRLRERDVTTTTALITAVRVHAGAIEIDCSTAATAHVLGLACSEDNLATFTLTAPVTLTRSGRAVRLVQTNGAAVTATANPSLIKLILKARRWWSMLRGGEIDIKALAAAEGVQASYVTRVVRLAFLSPAVVEAILSGTIRAGADGAALTATDAVPACWQAQGTAMLVG